MISRIFKTVLRLLPLFLFPFCLFSFQTQVYNSFSTKVIVFDFGNVIGKTDVSDIVDFIAATLQISNYEAKELLKKWHRLNAKKGIGMEFWEDYAASSGKVLPENWQQEFINEWCHSLHVIPGMIELVEELQRNGYQTAMLSNTTPFHAKIIRMFGYYDFFCPVLLSFQMGTSKPHRKAYEILLTVLKRPASECIFIDDKEVNVRAAKDVGIDAIQFFSADQLREELLKRGIRLNSISLFNGFEVQGERKPKLVLSNCFFT